MEWLHKPARRACVSVGWLLVLLAAVPLAWAQPQPLRIGVYDNAPKVEVDAAGQARGVFPEVIESIARDQGWQLQFVPGTFDEGLARLERGEIDLMSDVALSPSRRLRYSFHDEPVLQSWNQVYARHGSGIRNILDLSGKRVAVLRGSVQEDFFLQLAADFGVRPTVAAWPDYQSAFQAVARGEADAVVANPLFGAAHAGAAGLEDTSIVFAPSSLYFAGRRDLPPPILAAIDQALRAQKSDPRSAYFATLQRWTAQPARTVLPPWAEWAALAAVLLLLGGAGWGWTLRRAAARLRVSEARQRGLSEELERIFDHSLDVICVLDADFRFTRASRAAADLWGHAPRDLLGRHYVDLVPPQDRPQVLGELQRIRAGTPSHGLPSGALRADGQPAFMLTSGVWSPACGEMYCIARNDTERRQLLARLEARSQKLQRANEDLQTFSQTVSHDLRAPVSVIAGFVGKVLEDGAAALDTRSTALLRRALGATQRMDQLIDDLLRLAHVSQEGVHRQEVDVSRMAGEVVDALRTAAPGRRVEVAIEPGLRAEADPRLLRIVLENLLGNAWKFTGQSPAPLITVGRAQAGNGTPAFQVRDNGAGFDMAYADKLFAPFQRLHDQGEFPGTGIGLSIVERIVSHHGGSIQAEARPGEGAVFRFTLPPAAALSSGG